MCISTLCLKTVTYYRRPGDLYMTLLPAASKVARCDYSRGLHDDLQAVEQRMNSLQQKTDNDNVILDQKTRDLATDVDKLKGCKLPFLLLFSPLPPPPVNFPFFFFSYPPPLLFIFLACLFTFRWDEGG